MTYRSVNIVTILLLAGLLIVNHFNGVPWWVFVLVVWVYVSVIVIGCIRVSSNFFLPILCKGNTKDKIVALTFDDGPHPVLTSQILDTLKENNTSATFFCIGKNIAANEPLMNRIKEDGHIIGNHSFSHHFWFDLFGSNKMLADLKQTDTAVTRATGLKPALFRPPYGVTNPNVRKAIVKGKYIPIGWSIRSMDTVAKDKQKLINCITRSITAGDIILLHDTVALTAEILPELITEIKKKGFRIEPLDKMLNVQAYA